MFNNELTRILSITALLVWVCAESESAIAQQPDTGTEGNSGALEEIIVTAQKYRQDLQKTPAAVSLVNGEELTVRGVEDIRQATLLFPSVRFGEVATTTHLYIRGIGAEQDRASISPLSSMTLNGVYVPREIQSMPLFDLQNLQVLPGPQSTLYGTSAAGGAVLLTANEASFNPEASGTVEIGRFRAARVNAVKGGPVTDKLAVRVAADYSTSDGYYSSDANALDQWSARVSALWTPSDTFNIKLWSHYYHVDGKAADFIVLTGNRVFANPRNPWDDSTCVNTVLGVPAGARCPTNPFNLGDPRQNLTAVLAGADLIWKLPAATVTLTPGFVHDNQHELQYFGPFSNEQVIWNHQASAELRVENSQPDRLRWLAGLYYYKNTQYQFFNLNDSPANPELHNGEKTLALFGDTTYSLSQRLRISAGARLSSNNKEGYGCNCAAGNGEGIYFNFDHTWKRIDWKVGAEADLSPNSFLYATVQTGFTNGAYQYYNESGLLGAANAGPAPLVKPSTLVSYTAGVKNRFFDNRVQVNNEIFFYDYKDLLIAPFDSNPAHFGNAFYNANKVHIYGDQLDAIWSASANDRFSLSIGYLHARAVDFHVGDPVKSYDGLQLLAAPDWTANLGYRHNWSLQSKAEVEFQVNAHFESEWFGTFDHAPETRQSPYTKTDTQLTYRVPSGGWSVAIWGKNLENRAIGSVAAAVAPGFGIFNLEPPRTYGVRFSASY